MHKTKHRSHLDPGLSNKQVTGSKAQERRVFSKKCFLRCSPGIRARPDPVLLLCEFTRLFCGAVCGILELIERAENILTAKLYFQKNGPLANEKKTVLLVPDYKCLYDQGILVFQILNNNLTGYLRYLLLMK